MRDSLGLLSKEGLIVLQSSRTKGIDVQLLQEPLDWRRLLFIADRERAALPVWRALQAAGVVPDSEGARALRRMAQVWEFRLLHLEQLLGRTLTAFGEAGIDALLLKGAAAAVSVYGDFKRRPMVDVDLLVPEDQAEDAWQIAQTLGWRWETERYPKESYRDAHHLPPLYDTFGANCGLEIHRRLWMPGNPFDLDETHLLQRAETIEINGVACQIPHVTHQLLHCCIHFAWSHHMSSHGWRAFSDVSALVGSRSMNWEDFVSEASKAGAETCCYWTLRLAATVADISVPAVILDHLQPVGPKYLLDALERHFVMNLLPDSGGAPSLKLQRRLWQLALQRGRGARGIDLPGDPAPMSFSERIALHSKTLPNWYRYLKRLA